MHARAGGVDSRRAAERFSTLPRRRSPRSGARDRRGGNDVDMTQILVEPMRAIEYDVPPRTTVYALYDVRRVTTLLYMSTTRSSK